ncbi:MAG TPA: ATP-binding protein [Acidimicrobiales bacterium]|nr:ATP-binding protein [Acidimicrobiales bacterium]
MDTRVPAARSLIEEDICAHLGRHATEPGVVELARPLIRQALDTLPAGTLWLSVEWEDQHGRLRARQIDVGNLPGAELGPGVTRAHDAIGDLLRDHDEADAIMVSLNVARFAQQDIDPGPGDPDVLPDERPAHLLGLVAAEISDGHSLEEAAARVGATVAEREARRSDVGSDAAAVADLMVETERRLGGDFEVVSVAADRAVLRNRRCPFGRTSPAMCRFTSALAGGLGARAAGQAEVNVVESLAAGDHECRVVVELSNSPRRPVSHHYRWPPIPDEEPVKPNRGFQVTLSMQLPRDRLSVPVTRHLIRAAMREVGVIDDDADAVELAITEACANVIDHSGPGDAYEVSFTLGTAACHIRVIDVGRGFDHRALSVRDMAATDAEHGRGVALMHALVDQVRFESEPERGTVVHLVKLLHFDDSSTARRLMLENPQDPPA